MSEGPFPIILPSSLVCTFSGWARLLPTARLDEHRHPENTMDPACAFGEQRKHLAYPFTFAEPNNDRVIGLSNAGAAGDHPLDLALPGRLIVRPEL
jgi:hypothetical protein